MTDSVLQILTYNIHKGFSPGRIKFLLPKMREAIETMGTDLVFLQEVQGQHKRKEKNIEGWPDASQCEFIAEQLWPHYAYGKNAIYEAGHHGNAILSQFPFSFWENINVATISRASRSLLHGVIEIDGKKLHLMCVHFGLFKAERSEQFKILCQRISAHIPDSEPLIIAGDFNEWRTDAMDYLETDLGMHEVFETLQGKYAKTFPAWRPTLQIDRIYFRGLELLDGQCLRKKPWRMLSDHLPLYAKFRMD